MLIVEQSVDPYKNENLSVQSCDIVSIMKA